MNADGRDRKPRPPADDLRRAVHQQAARAERLIQTLTRDLATERARSQALAHERDRLLVALARADATRVQLQEHSERLERTLRELDRDRRRLAEADGQLRAALEAEREGAAHEIRCLEEQVQELSTAVELLVGRR